MSDNPDDSLLSDLCTICHINTPKYRCPRCSTRTCSLPCSRRHKLWSQCSGVRDPAAYLKRNELATPSAFDRDFNFITGIERRIERAERDAENRGVTIDHSLAEGGDGEDGVAGKKRKRPQEMVKGEAGFLRGAENGGVGVVRAPRGMSRSKLNSSRWHPKQKCLNWTVEWITADGNKTTKNSLESHTIAEAYDRLNPLPRKEKPSQSQENTTDQPGEQQTDPNDTTPAPDQTPTQEVPSETPVPDQPQETAPTPEPKPEEPQQSPPEKASHRDLYFYLHRPRTTTKQPVLIPLLASMTLTSALRNRTVLEFPTIYALPTPPETLRNDEKPEYLLEEVYVAEHPDGEQELDQTGVTEDNAGDGQALPAVDLGQVDESKVLEVLKQDLFEPVPEGDSA